MTACHDSARDTLAGILGCVQLAGEIGGCLLRRCLRTVNYRWQVRVK